MSGKKSIKPLFILLEKAQAVVQKTSRENFEVKSFDFFLLLCLFDGRLRWKNHNQIKTSCTKTEKGETLAHRKRARSAQIRERTLELRQ